MIIRRNAIFYGGLNVFKVLNRILAFAQIILRIVRFFSITFRVVNMLMSKTACRASKDGYMFVFAVPFKCGV